MGKPTGKKKGSETPNAGDTAGKQSKASDRTSKALDEDMAIFIAMSQELKEEGKALFQKRDHEGAMLKYEKAVKLLPENHIDIAYLRTNMAQCYMKMGLGEYPHAINECNLALEVAPRYSKALLRRAKCYESLNRLDLAFRDAHLVLNMEPNNSSAVEIFDRVKKELLQKGVDVAEIERSLENVQPVGASRLRKVVNEKLKKKMKKKKTGKAEEEKKTENVAVEEVKEVKRSDNVGKNEKIEKGEDKAVVVVEKNLSFVKDKEVIMKTIDMDEKLVTESISKRGKPVTTVSRTVKLVFGEDIRFAQLPMNCSIGLVRDIVHDRFSSLKGILIKYKDTEGDLVTITTTDELRSAESSSDSQWSLKLYISEVDLDQEPVYEGATKVEKEPVIEKQPVNIPSVTESDKSSTCIENWIVQFARLFKNHVGFDSDSYLDLHSLGMKLYSEAIEDSIASDEAQELFEMAIDKFQEMAALAIFNWGNVHMSKARRCVSLPEDDSSREDMLELIKTAYNWATTEYSKATMKYMEALKIKPDFYEAYLALGQQQFEQARLCWYHARANNKDLDKESSQEVLQLYNKAEESMEKGMQIWEESEEQRLNGLSKFDKYKAELQKMGLGDLYDEISGDDCSEQATNMSSQIHLLWGTLLYERSIVEFRLELPTWEECLEVAVEKFELAGASPTDVAVMMKNHCSNKNALEGLGFKIDEIVQAWNEMYDAKRWQTGVPSFRLEPLFRRRVPKLHDILEQVTTFC